MDDGTHELVSNCGKSGYDPLAYARGSVQRYQRRTVAVRGRRPHANFSKQALAQMTAAAASLAERTALPAPPFWVPLMGELMAYLVEKELSLNDGSLDQGSLRSIPFADAIAPLMRFGMGLLDARISDVRLPEPAAAGLRVQLSNILSRVCSLTFGEEYLRFRLGRGWTPGRGEDAKELYRAFVAYLSNGGLVRIFRKYPVLARLVATCIHHWVDDMASFLLRLDADSTGIAHRFFAAKELPPIRSIQSSLSDPHRKGCTVKIVAFEDGRKIVYKPKSLAMDEAWMELAGWLRDRDHAIDPRAPQVWNHDSYGWLEYIDYSGCESIAGIQNFYRRAGMLTCLFYVVRGTDFHFENLIAAGEHPVPIDMETLFAPQVNLLLNEKSVWTVVQTWMLPRWEIGVDHVTAFDYSGLGTFTENQDAGPGLTWTHVNTDAMQLVPGRQQVTVARNMPTLPGRAINPGEFVEEIVQGFERTYLSMLRHREALLSPESPLERFRNCPARVLLRASRIYAAMLLRSLTPRLLTSGLDRSREFEVLNRPLLAHPDTSGQDQIFKAEVEALEQMDIPYFEARTDLDAIRSSCGRKAHSVIAEPSFDAVRSQLKALNQSDLQYQVALIRSSFEARRMRCCA